MNSTQINANGKANLRESSLLYPELGYIIQGCVFEVRNQYGPGQKEVIYQRVLAEKLKLVKLKIDAGTVFNGNNPAAGPY